jgi:predicted dehydrogenase
MATSAADCEVMLAACERAGSRLAINHQMRFMDQYKVVRDELDSGRLGRLASMTVVAGCFGLAMNGSHYCEAFHWLTGARIVEASAWFSPERLSNPRGAHFADQAGEVRFVTSDGRRLILNIGADQGHGMTVTYAGQFGHMFVDELEGVYYVSARKAEHRCQPMTRYGMPWERREGRFPQADNVGPTKAVMAALLAGVGYPTGEDGASTVRALAAAMRSADEGGRPVAVAQLGDYRERRFPWA